ncbi:MAG TPA: hypothetical protein VH591_05935 [Ktedonobacterales bacterium]
MADLAAPRKDKADSSDMSAVAGNTAAAWVVAALLDSQVADSEDSWDSSGRPSSAFFHYDLH